MPGRFLSDAERGRLRRFPETVSSEDVVTFFTLSEADLAQVRKRSGDYNRLGFALQLCTLRYLGFSPHDLTTIPTEAVAYVARQLVVAPQLLISYGARDRTRHQQVRAAMEYLGFRRADAQLQRELASWLLERALEHDKPSVLFELLCERLRASKILRPGIARLERMVAAARETAWAETFRRMQPLLGPERRAELDALLRAEEARSRIPIVWLRQGETSNTADAVLNALARLEVLEAFDTSGLAAAGVPPNRLKFLARIGRKATTQALVRMPEARRYQVLLAFVDQAKIEVRDEAIDLFDRSLAQAYANAGRELKEFRQKVARSTNEKVHLLRSLGAIVLDPTVDDEQVRARIYDVVDPERLHEAIEECARIARPLDDNYFDLLADRYSHLRKFAPAFLAAFEFHAGPADAALLEAVNLLRRQNAERTREIPAGAPLLFIPARWWPYVIGEDRRPNRRYYELCVLWELRGALRAGNLWIENSRRYGDPASLLVPPDRWEQIKAETCAMLGLPSDAKARLSERREDLERHLRKLEEGLPANSGVRIEDGQLVVTPLSAEQVPESTSELERLVSERLPRVDLADLLIEIDSWTGFSRHFTHAAGSQPRTHDERTYLYAAILAQGCNFGTGMMAEVAELDARRLAWYTTCGKLQAFPRRNALTGALQEYGRLVKTIFVARYLQSEDYRRRIGAQLNKGEALHALRAFLFFANEAKLRKKQEEQHASQAGCLNLVTNAVVAWNTVYMEAVLTKLRGEGVKVEPEAVAHLSPARHSHINPYGRYRFEFDEALAPGALRPLRSREDELPDTIETGSSTDPENPVR